MLADHKVVFNDELGTLHGTTVKLHIDRQSVLKFCKARSILFSLKKKVESELQRLEDAGVISPIRFSDWAMPTVPVTKRDGSVRICGDYKITLNRVLKSDVYLLPKIEELFMYKAGFIACVPATGVTRRIHNVGDNFHSQGIIQIQPPSMWCHHGTCSYSKSWKAYYKGYQVFAIYLDDILVTGKTQAEHLKNLNEVLTRLEKAGMRLKKNKCVFMMSVVEYLGHKITKDGLQPSESKVEAVTKAPFPGMSPS